MSESDRDRTVGVWLRISGGALQQAVEKLNRAAKLAYEAQQELQSYMLMQGELYLKDGEAESDS